MVEVKKMSGILNLDSPYEDYPPFHHRYLLNGRFRESGGGMQLQRIPGNIHIPNYLLPAGTNQCIGAFYDAVKRRILWANYNSNGRNGWYKYDLTTKEVSKIFLCFTDSATDILRFSKDYPIHSPVLVYRPDADGDLLYWTDNNQTDENHPRYLNIDTVSTLAPFTETMINAAKLPPLGPPSVAYGNDSQATSNKLQSKLFRFFYRWVYKNGETSTFSPISRIALPDSSQDPNDSTKNNYIAVGVTGGGNDYQAIEIAMQQNEGNVWSDPLFVVSLDRDDYSILPGAAYTFNFYNDAIYTSIDLPEFLNYYDRLPLYSETMELLNGNVIVYANNTDGYNPMSRSDVDVIVGSGYLGIGFAYSSAHSFVVFVASTTVGAAYQITFTYSSGAGGDSSPKSVNYTVLPGDTVQTIAAALIALIDGNNIICTNLGAGVFSVNTTTGSGTITNVLTVCNTISDSPYDLPGEEIWDYNIRQRLALIYFDQFGKPVDRISYASDSAIDATDFSVSTPEFSATSGVARHPFVSMAISHTPPEDAVSYQILRAAVTPPPLYVVTSDYDSDTNYIYVCIENLYYLNSKNTGFVPTYSFSKGDRCIINAVSQLVGTSCLFTKYNVQNDFEILGVEERTMPAPAIKGKYLKLKIPTTMPSAPYQDQMLIKIYTPIANISPEEQVYYEWGQKYDIYESGGVRYHRGMIDQTASNPATFVWFNGDMYFKKRDFYLGVNVSQTVDASFISPRQNEYFESSVNSNGRGWALDPDAKRVTNSVEIRWGGVYYENIGDNQLNRFYEGNFDVLDRFKGPILRLLAEERLLYIYHSRAVGSIGVNQRYIRNNQGQNELIASEELITKNNIYYLAGGYGLGDQPCGLFRGYNFAHYFYDPVRGSLLRRSGDGITDITELYFGQYAIRDMVAKYNVDYIRVDGSKAKLLGFYDFLEQNAHFIMQGGTFDGETIPSRNLTFNERRNAFRGFESWQPDWALQAGKVTFSWKDGSLWVHNDETNWCRFYGKDYPTEITLLFTGGQTAELNKIFNAIGYDSANIWECSRNKPLSGVVEEAIQTSFINPQTGLRQTSRLKNFNFTLDNGKYSAGLLRDINSSLDRRLGLWEGDFLEGVWMEVTFIYSGSDFATLDDPYCLYQISNRNF